LKGDVKGQKRGSAACLSRKVWSAGASSSITAVTPASSLKQTGYKITILDMRLKNYRNFKVGNPIFVGISSMSGQQISYGLEFARKVRDEAPSCPIVWGGVHPTLLPEQTAGSEFVDVVIRGESELWPRLLGKTQPKFSNYLVAFAQLQRK